jgi:hypothetical protein
MCCRYLNSLTAVLTWSRLTLYMGDVMPRAKELSNTLATAFLDMQYLLLILLLVFFGFALAFQQAFGDFIVQFSSLYVMPFPHCVVVTSLTMPFPRCIFVTSCAGTAHVSTFSRR